MSGRHGSLEERFWPKVDAYGDCWLWTASLDSKGYGQIGRGGRRGGIVRAHRVVYELLVGPIPEGLDLDHLCRVRHCVNPDHLEPVTRRENLLRGATTWPAINAKKTHCIHGHELTSDNIYWYSGWRQCRACERERGKARR